MYPRKRPLSVNLSHSHACFRNSKHLGHASHLFFPMCSVTATFGANFPCNADITFPNRVSDRAILTFSSRFVFFWVQMTRARCRPSPSRPTCRRSLQPQWYRPAPPRSSALSPCSSSPKAPTFDLPHKPLGGAVQVDPLMTASGLQLDRV